jgi:nucleotide-binding universal stress UspA family protein
VPVLVLRGECMSWMRGERRLRVLVGVDVSTAAAAAARWAMGLSRLGPCDFTLLHCVSEGDLARLSDRLTLRGEPPVDHNLLMAALQRDLAARIGPHDGALVLDRTPSTAARRLATLAAERGADLVVIGAPARRGLERIVYGSTAHGLLSRVSSSIALVPGEVSQVPPRLRCVVVPVDFTPGSQRAVVYARTLLDDAGTLVLVHVSEIQYDDAAQREARHRDLRQRMLSLVSSAPTLTVQALVVEEAEAGAAIVTVAERVGADMICMGTRKSSLAKSLLGSVALAVVAASPRPVVLVPPDRA